MPAIPVNNYIGENIIAARTNKGITQLALAHAIGWTGPDAGAQICRYEAGENEPRLSTLLRIADALGVTIDALTKAHKK